MSGPVRPEDAPPDAAQASAEPPVVEVTDSREAMVGTTRVRRALPRRGRRTVGAWCFADHMGPVDVDPDRGVEIGPHPHTGLHTVTWLLDGRLLHRDSLGSEQVIRPGQLNLMTAGHGVAHAEESDGEYGGTMEGVQLWVAQPDATRGGPPAFEHHASLPLHDLANGVATVLVGELDGVTSEARADTPMLGADLDLRGPVTLPLRPEWEYALLPLRGAVGVEGTLVAPGRLAYLGQGRDELAVDAPEPARALLLGGEPFPDPVVMWWNFVARSREDIAAAYADWQAGDDRFGRVESALPRIPAPEPPAGYGRP